MTTTRQIYCVTARCANYYKPVGPLDDPIFVCKAFPKGIPEEILSGRNKHTKPFKGDNGIHYKERK